MTAAARAASFKDALTRIGFNAATVAAIEAEGFSNILDLLSISEDQIDKMVKHMGNWRERTAPTDPPTPPVNFPFLVVQKLKALHYWASLRKRQGITIMQIDASNFTKDACTLTMLRLQEESDITTALKDQVPTKPGKLGWDLAHWPKFWETLKTYLSQCRGAAHIPLTYLIREHDVVTLEMHDMGQYTSVDDYMVATMMLSGDHYKIDNARVYNDLKPLIVDGAGWAFIKKFDRVKNGRGALLALKKQAEGNSAKRTRKATAYASLSNARYRGERRNFAFSNYVQIHQDGHNELLELEEPVPETKKVQDFLSGIMDSRLQVGKDIVLGTPLYLQDFEECQQYLSTLVSNTSAQSKNDRHVGSAGRQDRERDESDEEDRPTNKKRKTGKFEKKHEKPFDKNKHKPKKPLTARSYSNNEWKAMEDDEKAKVKVLRDAKKSDSGSKPRKMGSVMSDHGEEPPPEEPQQADKNSTDKTKPPTTTDDKGAGGQFGRRAHMSATPKED